MPSSIASTLLTLAFASLPVATVSLSHQGDTPDLAVVDQAPAMTEVEDPTREIPASADGSFYAEPSVNGRTIRMMVDSGANITVLSQRDARALKISLPRRAFTQQLKTVGGRLPIAMVTLKHFNLAHRDIRNLRVAVPLSADVPSLLGHDVMAKFRHISIADDVLKLEA